METWLSLQRNVSISSAAPRPAHWGLLRTRFPFPTAHPQHPRCAHRVPGETRSRAQRWGRNLSMPSAVLGMLQLGWLAFFFFSIIKICLHALHGNEYFQCICMGRHPSVLRGGCMECCAWSCKQRGNFLRWADPTQLLKLFPTHPNHDAFPLVQHRVRDQLLGPAPSLKLI